MQQVVAQVSLSLYTAIIVDNDNDDIVEFRDHIPSLVHALKC